MKSKRLVAFGVLLVAVPVFLQLVMLGGLGEKLWSIHQNALRATESRIRINQLTDCVARNGDFLFLLLGGGAGSTDEEIINEAQKIEKETMDLLAVDYKDSESVAQAAKAKRALKVMIDLVPWVLKIVRTGQNTAEREASAPLMGEKGFVYITELGKVLDIEMKKLPSDFSLSQSDRANVRNWLTSLVAVNIIVSGLMALFFVKWVKQPITRISNNLKLLSAGQPLMPALNRKDELGALDSLIHNTATELDTALARERALIEKAADLICSLDEGGAFLTANLMATRMLGYQPAELVGKKVNELTTAEDSFAADELIRRAIRSNNFEVAELSLRKADGTIIDTRWSCLWSDQESNLFCVVHDVTQEKELARMKQDFMNMISHDLRSPLTSVMGGLQILATGSKGELSESMREETQSAIRSAEKLVSFISDLLDFQKLNAGQMPIEKESIKAVDALSEAASLVSAFAKHRGITIKVPAESADVMVVCDRQKVVQVIVNFLSNAIKFAPENSEIVVGVERKGDEVRFFVNDNGPGVPEDMRVRIFEPFEQLRSNQNQGTGLGLAICKMIVDAHNGKIGVESRSPQGSSFWFSIPRD